jgi:hypothetical protein
MSDMTEALVSAVSPHAWSVQDAATPDGIEACARGAVRAALQVLVSKAFPDDDVDYTYACEELAMDACETLRALDEADD